MKKFIMSFLVAGLVIVSAISLSSCKKTDTNGNANMEEQIPTVYDLITSDGAQSLTKDGEWIDCYYCTGGFNPYPDNRLYMCEDHPLFINDAFYCEEHSHIHYFEATEDCTPPNQTSPYFCVYKGLRKHKHILTYTPNYFFNGWHLGGGADGQ